MVFPWVQRASPHSTLGQFVFPISKADRSGAARCRKPALLADSRGLSYCVGGRLLSCAPAAEFSISLPYFRTKVKRPMTTTRNNESAVEKSSARREKGRYACIAYQYRSIDDDDDEDTRSADQTRIECYEVREWKKKKKKQYSGEGRE